MGYKTKSMIYAESLKETNAKAADKAADKAAAEVNIEKKEENNKKDENKKDGTYNDGTRTTITVGNKSEYTGGNEGVSAGSNTYTSSGQNLGVLSGLASGSTGTRIGTALGILTNKSMKLMAKRKVGKAKKSKAKEDQQFSSMSDSHIKTKIAAERAKSYLGSFKKNETNLIQTKPPEEQALTTSMSQIIPQNEIGKIKKPNYAIQNLKEKKLKKKDISKRKEKINKKIDKNSVTSISQAEALRKAKNRWGSNKEFTAFQGKNGYRYVLDTHQKNK